MAELTNADLTIADELQTSVDGRSTIHGTGTFDDLMEAVNKHLEAQFSLGRIQGVDYANAYASSLQAAMSSAVQYLLGRANAELIDAQIAKIVADILLVQEQVALTVKQGQKIDAETSLLQAKEATEAKQVEVLAAQIAMIGEQAKGFEWSAGQKYLKTLIDGQAINANIEGVGITGSIYSEASLETAAQNANPY